MWVAGKFHPYRHYIVSSLKNRFNNFLHGQTTQSEASLLYNKSLISLNVSLNSDLNWRFFEVIAAGGFLLTDRLPDSSGISEFLHEGKHFEAYSSLDELIDKVKFYLNHPIGEGYCSSWTLPIQSYLHPRILKKNLIKTLFGPGSSILLSLPLILALNLLPSPSVLSSSTRITPPQCFIEYILSEPSYTTLVAQELSDFPRLTYSDCFSPSSVEIPFILIRAALICPRGITFILLINVPLIYHLLELFDIQYIIPVDYSAKIYRIALLQYQYEYDPFLTVFLNLAIYLSETSNQPGLCSTCLASSVCGNYLFLWDRAFSLPYSRKLCPCNRKKLLVPICFL